MTSDLDIFRSANELIGQHGEDAPIHAAMRADAMIKEGDLDGYAAWKRIVWAVKAAWGASLGGGVGVDTPGPNAHTAACCLPPC